MRLAVMLLIGLMPTLAAAQDSVTVAVPEDRNCPDFVSQQDAQGWYDAMQIITGEEDPHGLDADGDGQPCESIEVGKREVLGDSVWVDYRLRPYRVRCAVGIKFTFDELISQAYTAMRDSVPYRGGNGVWPRWECVHTISEIVSQ